ncbi:hypothetical protein [Aliikangiella maris]|uniref:Uncharacterized protein n=2 Tax=Aliikangiella maris TaxID=3162458 RepID=A0ABV3MQN4_9GAMM
MGVLKVSLFMLTSVSLAGCSNLPFVSEVSLNDSESEDHEVAVLTDYQVKDGFITIQAVGYGCTFFNSFSVEVADKQSNALEIVRLQPDQCRMKPRNVSLQYSFKHLGLDLNKNVKVVNPVSITSNANTAAN